MELSQDLRELLTSFLSHDVEFVVVGAHVLVANKRATARTKDMADLEALGEA